MATFKDSQGRAWNIKLTIGLAARLNSQFDLDFVTALDDPEAAYKVLGELFKELDVFCRVIHVAAQVDLDVDEFMEGFDGETVSAAFEALDQAFTDFYPPAKRERVTRVKQKLKDSLEENQQSLMPEIEEKIEREIGPVLRRAAGLSVETGS